MNIMNIIRLPFPETAADLNVPLGTCGRDPFVPSPVILKLFSEALEQMRSYNEPFGPYLVEHSKWTSEQLHNFLRDHANDPVFVGDQLALDPFRTQMVAFLHDWGKVAGEWQLTIEKQSFTDEQKQKRKLHGPDGLAQLDRTMVDLGLRPTDEDMKFIQDVKYMMLWHHERQNGSGPFGKKSDFFTPALSLFTIIDTVHGKMKSKLTDEIKGDIAAGSVNPADKEAIMQRLIYGNVSRASLDAIFAEMEGKKHKGEFDLKMLGDYKAFLMETYPAPSMPKTSIQPDQNPLQF